MKSTVLVKYRGGISKTINKDEEPFEIETQLSLNSLIAIIFSTNTKLSESNSLVEKQSVLLMVNEKFIPFSERENLILNAGDVITLFPTVSGG